jgi:hypothetical protein
MVLNSTNDVWHVLDVAPNSPADSAGILPYGDYIIGSPEGIMRGESGLSELVEDVSRFYFLNFSPPDTPQYLERPLALYIYNHEYNVTRPVDITPSRHWGGQGALGCTLGYGALHKIPAPLEEPPNAPGEMMFDTSLDEKQAMAMSSTPATQNAEFLVPAEQFQQPPQTTTIPPPKRERKQKHTHISPSAEIDEYFREGEEKSKEEDHAPSPKPSGGLPPPPPPPKAGGPPKATSPSPE